MAKNNLLVFSGVNRRYKYIMNKILDIYPNTSLVVQQDFKGDYKGKYDGDDKLDREIINLINSHLEKRDEIEAQYYTEDKFHISKHNKVLYVTSHTLNSDKVVKFVEEVKPSLVFVFGVGFLKKNILEALKNCKIINLHFGLTPHYRGSDTLLWPLYLQNPGHIGITLHQIDEKVDHGMIYYQQKTIYSKEDSLHDIFCKTIVQAVEPTLKLIELLLKNKPLKAFSPKKGGKVFYKGEFTPNHLKVIYELIDNGMITKYLEGKYYTKELELYSCLK